jgi:hypothetical protein
MVEISLSGSGEGPGRETGWGYSTKNQDIVTRFLNNEEFSELVRRFIVEKVYREVRQEQIER